MMRGVIIFNNNNINNVLISVDDTAADNPKHCDGLYDSGYHIIIFLIEMSLSHFATNCSKYFLLVS